MSSIIGTREVIGGRVTVELVPGQSGTCTHIETAEREGLLIRDEQGNLTDVPPPWAPVRPTRLFPEMPQEERDRLTELWGWGWDLPYVSPYD